MRRYFYFLCLLLVMPNISLAWQREINAQFSNAGETTYREIRIQNRGREYKEIRLQVLGSPASVNRLEIVGEDGMSLPAIELDGTYDFQQAKYYEFPKTKIRSIRSYVTTQGASNLIFHFR